MDGVARVNLAPEHEMVLVEPRDPLGRSAHEHHRAGREGVGPKEPRLGRPPLTRDQAEHSANAVARAKDGETRGRGLLEAVECLTRVFPRGRVELAPVGFAEIKGEGRYVLARGWHHAQDQVARHNTLELHALDLGAQQLAVFAVVERRRAHVRVPGELLGLDDVASVLLVDRALE